MKKAERALIRRLRTRVAGDLKAYEIAAEVMDQRGYNVAVAAALRTASFNAKNVLAIIEIQLTNHSDA